jgi:hypothetical protein
MPSRGCIVLIHSFVSLPPREGAEKEKGKREKGEERGGTEGEEGVAGGWPSSSGAVVRAPLGSGDPARGGAGLMVLAHGEVRGGVAAECGNGFGGVASKQCWGAWRRSRKPRPRLQRRRRSAPACSYSLAAPTAPRHARLSAPRRAGCSSPCRQLPAVVRATLAAPAADLPRSAGGSPPRAHHYGR